MGKKLMLLGVISALIVSTCSHEPRALTETEMKLAEADNVFALKLFQEIAQAETTDINIFVSPLSVAMALGMTYNGAAESTLVAMQYTLELDDLSIEEVNEGYRGLIELLTGLDSEVDFLIANSLWHRQDIDFEDDFLEACEAYYKALVSGVDFSDPGTKALINNWVNDNTHGKIIEIIDYIDPLTVMIILNAIYFKGTWTYRFDETKTRDDFFTVPDGSEMPCKMMVQEGNFRYFVGPDFEAIDLPYGDEYFSMTVFLPAPDIDIDSFITRLDLETWNQWLTQFSEQDMTLELPKFTLEYELVLNQVLKVLGMEIAFIPGQADFTNMYQGGGLNINEVKHKTFVQVDEKGTEAAAATSVSIITGGPPLMRIDHPFFFVIRDSHSQSILFMGIIVEPPSS